MSNNHNHHNNKITQLPPSRANGTTQACAACRYQRRKCAPDCILAPYFPHDRQRQFQNAHKLFGVSNITKIIRNLDQPQKDEAMRTIIFQSDVRANDPVGGCYRVILELQRQIEFNRAELDIVLHQLAICRAQAVQTQNQLLMTNDDSNSTLNCGDLVLNAANVNPLCSYDDEPVPVFDYSSNHHLDQVPQQDQHNYILGQEDDDDNDDHVVPLQEINAWAMHNSASASLEVKQPSVDECDDIKPLLLNDIPTGETRHEFQFELEDTNEPSSDEIIYNEDKGIMKEENGCFQHNEDHDLKGAATLFTLTNCTSY